MGTRLIARGLDLAADDPCLWNLTHPEVVVAIHRRDVAAGADAIVTNTFGANRRWLARHGRADEDARLNARAVVLAREAAGPDRFVIGDIGPYGLGDLSCYLEQAEALARAGVEALYLETHTPDQAVVGLGGLRRRFALPILVGLFVPPERWPEGTPERLRDAGADLLGANCVRPKVAADITARLEAMDGDFPLFVKPSAEPASDPADWLASVPLRPTRGPSLPASVRLYGGCCGTDDRHVGLLREVIGRDRGGIGWGVTGR